MSSELFPTLKGVSWPVVKTPQFYNLQQVSESGLEVRAILWTYPRWTWKLKYDWLRDDSPQDLQTLLGFWLARSGSGDSFLFNDINDNSVSNQPMGTGNGTQTVFQLVRTYGGYTEPVLAPTSYLSIADNGTGLPSSAFTVGPGGVVTFATPPASGHVLTVGMTYYWPVRFLNDTQEFSRFMARISEVQSLEFISLKNYP